ELVTTLARTRKHDHRIADLAYRSSEDVRLCTRLGAEPERSHSPLVADLVSTFPVGYRLPALNSRIGHADHLQPGDWYDPQEFPLLGATFVYSSRSAAR